jgi:cyclohexyl-isocyanide hydratase
VQTFDGVAVQPNYTLGQHPSIDIVFVPGGAAKGVVRAMFDLEYQSFLKKAASTASWTGSVCVGAFILAAARLLDDCRATTYWSQKENLELLRTKMNIRVERGYPRFVIDELSRRFSGGGVSSSIDLALELVTLIAGKSSAESAQLSIQYAPKPPTNAGDPCEADRSLVDQIRASQEEHFIRPIREAVETLLNSRD